MCLVGGHQCGQAEIVVPKVEGVIAGGRRAQVPAPQHVHGRGCGVTDGCPVRPRAAGMWCGRAGSSAARCQSSEEQLNLLALINFPKSNRGRDFIQLDAQGPRRRSSLW